jgi:hypothetical protein
MKKAFLLVVSMLMVMLMVSVVLSAYHHEGEKDSPNFLAQYPSLAGSKLDHCATCHTGGQYVNSSEKLVSLGSCQWCHYTYKYDGSGNIVDTLNTYGMAYLTNGRNQAALAAIEGLDSDGDGYTNAFEIAATHYPGNAQDDPTKVPAPSRVYSKAQLEAMAQHTQFMLMNTSRSGDYYAEYTGVPMEDLLKDAGILASATGITVFAPDGWSDYHPLDIDSDPELYHVKGTYPESYFYYDVEADIAVNVVDGWCDYSAPSCTGRNHLDIISNPSGLKMLLAYKREGQNLEPGVLGEDNKLSGEGPFRVVPPQKAPSAPDQSSKAANQDVVWPYNFNWDHNAGSATRTATIIRVEPLPEGTTDIDVLEAGWKYVDEEKIVVYGAIEKSPVPDIKANGQEGPLTVSSATPVSITVSLDPGDKTGQNADWWIVAYTSFAAPWNWTSYTYPTGWMPGINAAMQTTILGLPSSLEMLNMALPSGDYTFYFAIDSNADGVPDATWFDSVKVHVQ